MHGNGDYVQKFWGDLNEAEYLAIRNYMGRTDSGEKVLAALDNREIALRFTNAIPEEEGLIGITRGTSAKVSLSETKNGHRYELVGANADPLEFSANIGLHEGLHALGVGGSRRAEALVRLEELRSMGVTIDRSAMRQVLTDMSSNYDHFSWYSKSGRQSVHFPGLKF